MNVAENKKLQVIKAGLELKKKGLIVRTWGNVSRRIDNNSFAITPSGRNYESLEEKDIVQVRISDLSWKGEAKPSSEMLVHRAIYQINPEVNFIFHTHQRYASALGCSGLHQISYLKKSKAGNKEKIIVPIAKYGISGSQELCNHVIKELSGPKIRLQTKGAIIMKNHGVVCYGTAHDETMEQIMDLEHAAARQIRDMNIPIDDLSEIGMASANKKIEKSSNNLWQLINNSKCARKFSKEGELLKPYLDDFAMLIGGEAPIAQNLLKAKEMAELFPAVTVPGEGILCFGNDREDVESIFELVTKNILGYYVAKDYKKTCKDAVPVSEKDGKILRDKYINSYSKLAKD